MSSGTIVWEGHDITALKPDERARRGIAYVPQGREIFPLLTVEENLETGFAPDIALRLMPVTSCSRCRPRWPMGRIAVSTLSESCEPPCG